jgi:hypothetical protein
MSDLAKHLEAMRTSGQPAVPDTVGERLRLVMASLLAMDQQMHVCLGLLGDLLGPQEPASAPEQPGGPSDTSGPDCRHLEAIRLTTMGPGGGEETFLCPECGRIDPQGNLLD